ncbi:MAG: hypothetical protein AAFR61_03230 [Bacteroidota bacterium]
MKKKTFLLVVLGLMVAGAIYFAQSRKAGAAITAKNIHILDTVNYVNESFKFENFAEEQDGYWLIQPQSPQPDSAPVVVFLHGYSAYNPMVYGLWLEHLVQQGRTIIFPRYQESIVSPGPEGFIPNVVTAIKDAWARLDSAGQVKPYKRGFMMIGHSFGGAIIANMLADYAQYELPPCLGAFYVSPGTGPVDDYILEDYRGISSEVKMLIMVSDNDRVVQDVLGKKVFETAINTPNRNLVRQYADAHGEEEITAGHLEVYALNPPFDNGVHGYSYMRAQASRLDQVDLYAYWKLFDALFECVWENEHCEKAFGNTEAQRYMGEWSDGTPVRELEISVPEG